MLTVFKSWLQKNATYLFCGTLLLLIGFVGGVLASDMVRADGAKDVAEGVGGTVVNIEQAGIPDYLKKDVDFNLFWDVWNFVREDYVKQDVPPTQMFYGALAGLVASLGDPHSMFFDPETTKEFTQELSGSFDGIGAEVGIKNNDLTIIAPLQNSPAMRAGLLAGDKIYTIDGRDTSDMALDFAVSLIRGQRGTTVTLAIGREGADGAREITITRDTIDIPTVTWETKTTGDKKIAYIKIAHFNSDTGEKFNQAVRWTLEQNPDGILLDLRNNPGGFLNTAVDVASEWVDHDTVVIERFKDDTEESYPSNVRARLKEYKTAVLVNRGSASGSEIVAGALQDYGLATLVGETTFGKGSVQELKDLKDGSSIKLTIAKWLTPKKREIDQTGIEPDISVPLTEEDNDANRDPQLEAALNLFQENK